MTTNVPSFGGLESNVNSPSTPAALANFLENIYSSPLRHYHTVEHIEGMFKNFTAMFEQEIVDEDSFNWKKLSITAPGGNTPIKLSFQEEDLDVLFMTVLFHDTGYTASKKTRFFTPLNHGRASAELFKDCVTPLVTEEQTETVIKSQRFIDRVSQHLVWHEDYHYLQNKNYSVEDVLHALFILEDFGSLLAESDKPSFNKEFNKKLEFYAI